jgi:diguanylate cyclase (GGDEF)-like protein
MPRNLLPAQHLPVYAAALPLAGWAVHSGVLTARLNRARRDPLTGLLTRDGFERAARKALDHPKRYPEMGVAFVDLDRFKQVNDTHGHAAGDAALLHTAVSLRLFAGVGGTAARLGGDEFAAVLPVTTLSLRVGRLAARLHGFTWNGLDLPLSASVGVCRVADLPAPSLTAALGAADAAMYAAKQTSGHTGTWVLADPAHTHPDTAHRHRRTRTAPALREGA